MLSADLTPRLRNAGVDRWVRTGPMQATTRPTWIELAMGAKNKAAQRRRSTVKPS